MKASQIIFKYKAKLLIFFLFCFTFNYCLSFAQLKENHSSTSFLINPDNYLLSFGLIDLHEIAPDVKVILAYSTKDNIMKKDMYGNLYKCYLPREVALKIKEAQARLKEKNSDLSLLILDATRPLQIQKLMWDSLPFPNSIKYKYLAHPTNKSLHNYGAAIDVTLIHKSGIILNMGSPFDYFGELSKPSAEENFYKSGALTKTQISNRKILRDVLTRSGFKMIPNEWWHFEYCSKAEAQQKFKLVY